MSVPVQTSLAELLAQAEHRVARRLEAALGAADMSAEQWRILTRLADGAGHPMNEIAAFAMVPAPTLTKIIDRLIERGLVYRRPDTEDRRRVLVFLSTRGAELHQLVAIDVQEADRDLVETLGDEDAAQLADLLSRLLARVS